MIKPKSPERALLEKRFREMEKGEKITWEEASKIAGKDLQANFNRQIYQKSIDFLKKNERIFIDVIFGVGFKRLADGEIPEAAKWRRKKIQRQAKRNIHGLKCADITKMNRNEQDNYNLEVYQNSLISYCASNRTQNRIKSEIKERVTLPEPDNSTFLKAIVSSITNLNNRQAQTA